MGSKYLTILTGDCNTIIDDPAISFPYEPDHFQRHAFASIERDEDVLITAKTGSGKTVPAIYAIFNTKRKEKITVYTAPIKSLSNEKYNDFKNKYPDLDISLLTGDNKINIEATDLHIMTAEILRNMILNNNEIIPKIGTVIMDEVHYINDNDRGHVWETTIMLLPKHIQLIMLSATIDRSEHFAKWIGETRERKINLIPTTHRVVPLRHYIYTSNHLHKILDNGIFNEDNYIQAKLLHGKDKNKSQHKLNELVKYLKDNNLLQTIFFVFSRKNCEIYANMITEQLIDHEERAEVEAIFSKHLHSYEKQYNTLDQYLKVKEMLSKGIAYHHSGLIPILKEIIEIIFKKGLIKVLFATETMAVGVNMPTRTVVFTALEKHTDRGKRYLNTAEFTQMSGRAGRRGIDTLGHVILFNMYDFIDGQKLHTVMLGKVPHIESRFKLDYQFYLNSKGSTEEYVKKSLFYQECLAISSSINTELKRTKVILDQLETAEFKQVRPLNNCNYTIKLSKKQKKILSQLSRDENYQKYIKEYNHYISLKNDQSNNDNYIYDAIHYLESFLKQFNYVNDNILLTKGIIASHIYECNSLILTELIVNNHLNQLSPEEIVGLLAIFIAERPVKTLRDVIGTPQLKSVIGKVESIAQKFIENDQFNDEKYWKIYYDFVDSAYIWVTKKEIKTDLYIGNFIRNMLRINNMVANIINALEISGRLEMIPVLTQIEALIMRDFVSVDSLYL